MTDSCGLMGNVTAAGSTRTHRAASASADPGAVGPPGAAIRAGSPSAGDVPVDLVVQVGDGTLPLRRQPHVPEAVRVETPLLAFHVAEVLPGDQSPVLLVVLGEPSLEGRPPRFLALRVER